MRRRQFTTLAALVLFCFLAYTVLRIGAPRPSDYIPKLGSQPAPPPEPAHHRDAPPPAGINNDAPRTKFKPAPGGSHPMWHLIKDAEDEVEATKARQSKTLEEAVSEYRRRYGIPPPPNFDKWYEFATSNNVLMIDEFDLIHELITPFWGLKPATIRARAAEALGWDNALLGVQIR